MQTKLVNIRTAPTNGFWKLVKMVVDLKNPTCKFCGKTLYVSPGNDPYCNNWAHDHDTLVAQNV